MTVGNVWQPSSVRRRFVWSLLASMVVNSLLWLTTYPHLSFSRDVQKKDRAAASIRIEHRIVRHPHARRKPRRIPHPQARAKPLQRPHPPHVRRLPRHRSHPHAQPKPRHLPHAHNRPRPIGPSETTSFIPRQSAALTLPSSWETHDLGNGAAANTTLWLDFKKARGAFVPRVFLWHVKAEFLSGPTLGDAVHDILASLRAEGATVHVSKEQRVCGGKRLGWFLSYEKPNSDPPWQFEDTLFMAGDTVYRATYSRPGGQAEDTKTRAALDTLCPLS